MPKNMQDRSKWWVPEGGMEVGDTIVVRLLRRGHSLLLGSLTDAAENNRAHPTDLICGTLSRERIKAGEIMGTVWGMYAPSCSTSLS